MILEKAITVRPAVKKFNELSANSWLTKKRVAAYARVSTDNDEQLSSFEAQRNYYSQYIKSKSGCLLKYMLMRVFLQQQRKKEMVSTGW